MKKTLKIAAILLALGIAQTPAVPVVNAENGSSIQQKMEQQREKERREREKEKERARRERERERARLEREKQKAHQGSGKPGPGTTPAPGPAPTPIVTLSGITISGSSSVNEGATATFTAAASWSNGTKTSVSPTWSANMGTISASGFFSAPQVSANQTATINASYSSGGVTKTASVSVTVVNGSVVVTKTLSGITVSGSSSVNEGATAAYTATASWSDGTKTSVSPTWSANLGSISTSGVFSAPQVTANQTATIGASYSVGGVTKTASVSVTVVNGSVVVTKTLSGITISGSSSVNEGATAAYMATASWSDGTKTSVSPAWSANLGAISTSGVFSAPQVTANQAATIGASYSYGGVTRTASVAVTVVNSATSTIDGGALYTQYCSSCHGTSKRGKSATSTQNAINNNTGGMGFLSNLTSAQITAISLY
ncbi:MAG: cytochrome c [Deltaproteobacteria bacterium]|nr:cytochrome c [Deltaproteobacteria bacterium]